MSEDSDLRLTAKTLDPSNIGEQFAAAMMMLESELSIGILCNATDQQMGIQQGEDLIVFISAASMRVVAQQMIISADLWEKGALPYMKPSKGEVHETPPQEGK